MFVTFLLVFAAGAMMGWFWAGMQQRPRPRGSSWLADELGLSPEQRQQMETIWKEAAEKAQALEDRRRVLMEERDAAVHNMLSAAQRLEYREIMEIYEKGRTDLNSEREIPFQEAVERTKAILTPDQLEKYDHMLTRFPRGDRGGRTPGRRSRGPRPTPSDTSALSQPIPGPASPEPPEQPHQ